MNFFLQAGEPLFVGCVRFWVSLDLTAGQHDFGSAGRILRLRAVLVIKAPFFRERCFSQRVLRQNILKREEHVTSRCGDTARWIEKQAQASSPGGSAAHPQRKWTIGRSARAPYSHAGDAGRRFFGSPDAGEPDELGKIADTFNEIVAANQRMAQQLATGRPGGRAGRQDPNPGEVRRIELAPGANGRLGQSALIDDLLWPTNEVTRTIAAVAQGDLLQTVRLDVDGRPLKGEFLRSATIVNTMIKQLGVFTSEVTRVAREVGTDGKLGGQAQVPEVTGVWKDLTESVNSMAIEPHRPGAQHRRCDDRRRQRRPVEEDHRRRPRRNPAAQGSHQHDGRPAALLRLGGDARGARGRHRRQAGRPGASCRASPAPGRT